MTLRELIHHVTSRGFFNKVCSHLQTLNSEWRDRDLKDIIKKYKNVVDELTDLPGCDNADEHVLVINMNVDGDNEFIDVHMRDKSGDKWGVDFSDWNELIDIPIDDKISTELSEMLAHVLYEITWWGMTARSIDDQRDDMIRMSSDTDNLLTFTLSSIDS